ncbi:MAG: hypothetical protein AMJ43_06780 [Coxiella sp. DG_40]|nr:MAG: hypothetical protein AMJ43_06780 [Coxiella sp. DG_40]
MKEIYKNPGLYYILAPVAISLWSLFIWGIYLPDAERRWKADKAQYNKAQNIIAEILSLDPERLAFAGMEADTAEFDYANAVEKTASLCGIPSTDYKLSSGIIIESGGQKSQSAQVSLKKVDIVKSARFLSTIQLRWANLQCSRVKLTKKKGLPDVWDVDLEFKYYY